MSQAFDKYEKFGAYHYDWYDDPNYAWYKVCVDRCVEFCKGSTIDLGGGDGLVADMVAGNKVPVVVVDNSLEAMNICNNKRIPFLTYDLNGIEGITGVWEYICCLNVIEHLHTSEIIEMFIEHNITKGAIIITDMPTDNKGRYHEHEYTKAELLDTFKEFKPKYFVINSTECGKPIQFHGVEIKK